MSGSTHSADGFLKTFDFKYSEDRWAKIEQIIKKQPGPHNLQDIRETLEMEARGYRIVPQLETKTPRAENVIDASKIAGLCEHLKSLLTEDFYSRDYGLWTFLSRPDYDATVSAIEKLQGTAEATAANNQPLSRKNRQADPQRDEYLAKLCSLWAATIRGAITSSYSKKTGKKPGTASGPFVDFLFLAAQPALRQFTPNGAARFIKRWRKVWPLEKTVSLKTSAKRSQTVWPVPHTDAKRGTLSRDEEQRCPRAKTEF